MPMNIALLIAYLMLPRPSTEEVLGFMARLPGVETGDLPGRWDHVGNARAVAKAIATVAPDRETAALMTVYAVYEGGNRACAVGDHGRSLGPFQLQGVPRAFACDPTWAARRWLVVAEASRNDCATSEHDDQLAELASGTCSRGVQLARRREALARGVATELVRE